MVRNWTWRTRRKNRWVAPYPTGRRRLPPRTSASCRWNRAKSKSGSSRTKRCSTWSSRRSPTTRWMFFWRSCSAGSSWTRTSCSSTRSCARRRRSAAAVKVHPTWRQMSSSLRSLWSSPTDANRSTISMIRIKLTQLSIPTIAEFSHIYDLRFVACFASKGCLGGVSIAVVCLRPGRLINGNNPQLPIIRWFLFDKWRETVGNLGWFALAFPCLACQVITDITPHHRIIWNSPGGA